MINKELDDNDKHKPSKDSPIHIEMIRLPALDSVTINH